MLHHFINEVQQRLQYCKNKLTEKYYFFILYINALKLIFLIKLKNIFVTSFYQWIKYFRGTTLQLKLH